MFYLVKGELWWCGVIRRLDETHPAPALGLWTGLLAVIGESENWSLDGRVPEDWGRREISWFWFRLGVVTNLTHPLSSVLNPDSRISLGAGQNVPKCRYPNTVVLLWLLGELTLASFSSPRAQISHPFGKRPVRMPQRERDGDKCHTSNSTKQTG